MKAFDRLLLRYGLIGLVLIASFCKENQPTKATFQTHHARNIVKYARLFSIVPHENYTLLTILPPHGQPMCYALYPKDAPPAKLPDNCQPIPIPVQRVALYSTTYVHAFEILGCRQVIKAFAGTAYLYSDSLRAAVLRGQVVEIGSPNHLNAELLSQLHLDAVMIYLAAGEENKLSLLQRIGLTPVINFDFMENTPLGRAEWLKVVGLLCGKMQQADSIFSQIEKNYLQLVDKVKNVKKKPTVFANIPYGSTWYMPGGDSFMGQLFKDAGADYLWAEEKKSGSLPLSLEAVLAKAQQADFWINPGSMESIEMICHTDSRFRTLKAVQWGKVFNNNKRQRKEGGNDYWESGSVRADVVLADLIAIFHPEILPHRQLVYFNQLQ